MPSKSVTPSKSNSTTNITDNINTSSNGQSKDSNILPKLSPMTKLPTNSDIGNGTSDLFILLQQLEPVDLFIDLLVEEKYILVKVEMLQF